MSENKRNQFSPVLTLANAMHAKYSESNSFAECRRRAESILLDSPPNLPTFRFFLTSFCHIEIAFLDILTDFVFIFRFRFECARSHFKYVRNTEVGESLSFSRALGSLSEDRTYLTRCYEFQMFFSFFVVIIVIVVVVIIALRQFYSLYDSPILFSFFRSFFACRTL